MKQSVLLLALMASLLLTCTARPAESSVSTAQNDTVQVFAARIRQLEKQNIGLMAQIKAARIDSLAIEAHHQIEIDGLNLQIQWLKDERGNWFERALKNPVPWCLLGVYLGTKVAAAGQ